jgi:hypothetical protein
MSSSQSLLSVGWEPSRLGPADESLFVLLAVMITRILGMLGGKSYSIADSLAHCHAANISENSPDRGEG